MKKRPLILLSVPGILLLFVAFVLGWFEPRYAGMRASMYVFQELDTPRFTTFTSEQKLKPMGAKLALPGLIKALKYEDSAVRLRYAQLHQKFPLAVRKHLPAPRSVQYLRYNAITALNAFGPDAAPAVPLLVQLYNKGDGFQRQAIAYALASIGPAAQPAVPALLNDLTNTQVLPAKPLPVITARPAKPSPAALIAALGKIDLSGELSAHELVRFANTWDPTTTITALNALGNMSRLKPALTSNLWNCATSGIPNVRPTALRNLNELGLLTRAALDPFFPLLTNTVHAERLSALVLVTFSTNFETELLPVLSRMARGDPEPEIRNRAFGLLLMYGGRTNVAPQLREEALFQVYTRTTNVSWAAMDAVRGLAPHGETLVPSLIPMLSHPDERHRGKAAEALGQLGPAARIAAPQLRLLLNDEWSFVREAATNALRRSTNFP